MINRFGKVSSVVVACLAIAAASAPGAQAVEFHSSSTHTLLTGSQLTTHQFSVGSGFGAISCKTAEATATAATATSTTQSVTGTYSSCVDSFGRATHIATNGCNYKFHATAKKEADVYTGTAALECSVGKSIELKITSSGVTVCTVTISAQSGLGPLTFKDETGGSKKAINISANVNNIKTTTAGGLFNCGIANGEHTAGTYTGDTLIQGTDTVGAAVNIWVE